MKTILLSLALAVILPTMTAADIQGFATGLSRDSGDPLVWNASSRTPQTADFQGEFYTTPDKCTYRLTWAPGHDVLWILIVNPHHIGRPAAHRGCPGML